MVQSVRPSVMTVVETALIAKNGLRKNWDHENIPEIFRFV